MTFWDKIEQNPLVIKHPKVFEFLKFAVVGVLGTLIDFSIYAVLTRVFGLYYILATAISVWCAILNNFFLNKYWTFRRGQSGRTRSEYFKFFVVSVLNYFFNLAITYFVVEYTRADLLFGKNEDFFAKAVAIAVVLFSNYFGNKYWTFKPAKDQNQ